MVQIILVALVLVIAVPIVLNSMTDFDSKQKWYVYAFLGVIISLMVFYQLVKEGEGNRNREVVLAFSQGKEVACKETVVTNKDFNYVSGTLSFVAKEGGKYNGVLFSVEECMVK